MLNSPELLIDVSHPGSANRERFNSVCEHVYAIEAIPDLSSSCRVNVPALPQLNILPQDSPMRLINMHFNYVQALSQNSINKISINLPANQLGISEEQIRTTVRELLEKIHLAGIDIENDLALMLVLGNSLAGKPQSNGKPYNIFQHIENVVACLRSDGLEGKVDLYTGLYPTGYCDVAAEKIGMRLYENHYATQMRKVAHLSKQNYPGFRGYMTQMTFHPSMAAEFASDVLSRCLPHHHLFLGFSSRTDTMFATKVIRTQLKQMTGDPAYGVKESFPDILFYTLFRLGSYKRILCKLKLGSLDMLWRFWYSKTQDACRSVHLFYDDLRTRCDKEDLAKTHIHWNTGFQLPHETAIFACEAAAAKTLAYRRYFVKKSYYAPAVAQAG